MAQDLELGGGQADPAMAALDPPSLEVDEQVTMADHPSPGGVGKVAVGASQEGPDPAHQLAQAERLGQVVVGTELQADHLVDLVVAGGQDQDGRLRAGGAQPAQDLEAVDPRQTDVEHDQVGRLAGAELEALLTGAGHDHLVALLLKGELDPAGDGELVLDDQDGGGHGRDATPNGGARPKGSRGGLCYRARCITTEELSAHEHRPADPGRHQARRHRKKVARLRKAGLLPAVVYGHGLASQSLSLDTHEFELLQRRIGPERAGRPDGRGQQGDAGAGPRRSSAIRSTVGRSMWTCSRFG